MREVAGVTDGRKIFATREEWKQRWLELASQQRLTFDESFNNGFLQRLAERCSKDESDYLLRYFRSVVFCMRLFKGADKACNLWYQPEINWLGMVENDPKQYPFYAALHQKIIGRTEIDLEPIRPKVQFLYDQMWQKYDNLPQIESDHLLDPHDGQIVHMTVTYQ
jgi:hypothetical protein